MVFIGVMICEDLRNRPPRTRKEKDVNAHKRDSRSLRCDILRTSDSSGDSNDELTDTHAHSSHEQQVATTHLLDEVETWNGRDDVDAVGDDLDGETAGLETSVLKVLGAVVEDEVLLGS